METFLRADGFDRRILNNIDYRAAQLSRARAVPGMEKADYVQDLLLDLLRRTKNFQPELSTYRTFADRLVRNRICSITAPTSRLQAERQWTSIDVPVPDRHGVERPLAELLPAECNSSDIAIGLQIDVQRLVASLSFELRETCEILLDDSVVKAAREVGVSRSTVYERVVHLRERAVDAGLDIYLKPDRFDEVEETKASSDKGRLRKPAYASTSDTSATCPVSDREPSNTNCQPGDEHQHAMVATSLYRPRLLLTEAEFCEWIGNASPGDKLEYHRGFLALDAMAEANRLPQNDQSELNRVAERARWASNRGYVRLVQRRHLACDYSYFAICACISNLMGGEDRA